MIATRTACWLHELRAAILNRLRMAAADCRKEGYGKEPRVGRLTSPDWNRLGSTSEIGCWPNSFRYCFLSLVVVR